MQITPSSHEVALTPIRSEWEWSGLEKETLKKIHEAVFRPKDALQGLLYLTSCEESQRSPLKEKQVKIAEASYIADRRTSRWLYGGVFASGVVLLNPLASPLNLNPWLTASALSVIGIAVNTVSYLATGFFPDCSSQRADERLMTIFSAKRQFKAMAHQLLYLSQSEKKEEKALAFWIAKKIDIDAIRKKMSLELHDKSAPKLVTKKLETVCETLLKSKAIVQTV